MTLPLNEVSRTARQRGILLERDTVVESKRRCVRRSPRLAFHQGFECVGQPEELRSRVLNGGVRDSHGDAHSLRQ